MALLSWASILLVGTLAVVGCVGPYQGSDPYYQDYKLFYSPHPVFWDPGWGQYALGFY
jgi:hypothetical protein